MINNNMTQKEIDKAAKDFAKEELGEEQYKENKDAAEAIADIFKEGVKWALNKR